MLTSEPAGELGRWLITFDPSESDPALLLERFASALDAHGIRVFRSSLWLPTAHPELWGTQVVWSRDHGPELHPRSHDVTSTETYLNTPGQEIYQRRETLRWRLNVPAADIPYPMLRELKLEGATDYVMVPFQTDQWHEQPWITLASNEPAGFSDEDLAEIDSACAQLAWKARWAMSACALKDLLHVYLGPNAAGQVLDGQFRRGRSTSIDAVVWFCDLRDFTTLGSRLTAAELVQALDRYFECVSGPIEEHGGEILKFIGDAILAVFPCDPEPIHAAKVALNAAQQALSALTHLSNERVSRSLPALRMGIALHVGEVLYGNIGGRSRLDFTVIGPAVNIASRVEGLCKPLDAPLLVTGAFAELLGTPDRLRDLGEHALRGVPAPQRVFAPIDA